MIISANNQAYWSLLLTGLAHMLHWQYCGCILYTEVRAYLDHGLVTRIIISCHQLQERVSPVPVRVRWKHTALWCLLIFLHRQLWRPLRFSSLLHNRRVDKQVITCIGLRHRQPTA
ncbi:hypothetical protein JB92DRAFT_249044 [Gautieria morchelliformis]|nr:hypothetical protein JB92DRAFT_249044 [Gautieria morchelliformis]